MTKRWTMCLLLLATWACIGSTTGCGSSTPCTYEGKTYKSGETFPSSDGCNTCSCNASGETSCTLRACIQTCGGLEEKVCTGEQVCVLQSGSCNAHAEGLCKEKQTCPDVATPVCGCDGKTYDNSCIAEQAGVQLKSTGPCPKRSCIHEGKTLQHGESKLNNGSCEECTCDDGKLTCQPDQCTCLVDGKAIKNGEEVTLKDGCETCVCDSGELSCHKACCLHEETYYKPGESYTTADKCELCTCQKDLKFACKGTTTCSTDCTYEGKRWTTGQTFPHKDGCNKCTCNGGTVTCTDLVECYPECGGTQGVQCGAGEICKYTFGGSCDTAGAKGRCIPVKTCSKTENEVCGCDQKTYLNQCTADMAGIKVAYSGPCKTSQPCGGRGLAPCGAEEFCNQPIHCGRTDIPGKCTPIAQGCTKEYSPVCGCGGQTYANECLAHAQGVSVQYAGACK